MLQQGHHSLVCGLEGRNKFRAGECWGDTRGAGKDMKADFYGNDESRAERMSVVNAEKPASTPAVIL